MRPSLRALWRRTSVRLTILAALLFAASVALILFYMVASTRAALLERIDVVLAREAASAQSAYARGGPNMLNRFVIERVNPAAQVSYLFARADGERISGEPSRLPPDAIARPGALSFVYEVRTGQDADQIERRRARGYVLVLPDGTHFLAWRDSEDAVRAVRDMVNQARVIAGLTLILGLASGAFLAQRFSARVEALNAVARSVIAGNLEARAPRTFSGDELDSLSGNLNDMLTRIDQLMTAMRHAGDSIAHDLRTPLTRLRNRLEAAALDAEADPRDALERALGDSDELLATFNAVLRLARIEAREKRQALEPLDISALIEDLAETYALVGEDAGVSFACQAAPDLWASADRTLLMQAVSNLLDNAIKYTPAGGGVMLRVRRHSSGAVEVSVTDTGPGIPASARKEVVKRFVRLDASRSKAGSGLGLALVQAVADLHAGTFTLEDGPGASEAGQGPGLRAVLCLPALAQRPVTA